jgi:hypothetical protein
LLHTQNLSVEPLYDAKQNFFVEPLPITNTNPFNTTVADNVFMNNIVESAQLSNNMVTSKKLNKQQRRTMMNKFMTNVNSSTSMYWKEDLPGDKNINNKSHIE